MLADLNYLDKGLIKDMVRGFLPTGVCRCLESWETFNKACRKVGGRMVFCECFAAGRTTNLLLKKFGSWYRSQRFVEDLAPEECELILALKQRVSSAEPIGISPKFMETWFISTDGA